MSARVLLLTPSFYGIEKSIQSVLLQTGYEVSWIENKTLKFDYHGSKSKFKFLRKAYYILFRPQVWYLKRELKKIENIRFDILFAVNAHVICPYLFRKLKKRNQGLYSVLYLWDSFSMYNWIKELRYFGKVYTFDKQDSLKHKLSYKPNFYIKNMEGREEENTYDLFFAGKFSCRRFSFFDNLFSQPDISGIRTFIRLWPAYRMLLHNRLIYSILRKRIVNNEWVENYLLNYEVIEGIVKRDFLVPESLDYEVVHNVLSSSNVVLDLPYPFQSGYTHRLIEALAHGKKIITTNTAIREEKFYNSDQIKVIDEQNPQIDLKWIGEEFEFPVDKSILDLELSKWLKSIIDVAVA
jgi:hypothetical protein